MIKKGWKTVTNQISLLGEGPVWDERKNRIIWLDILAGKIHQYYPQTAEYRSIATGQYVGAVTLTENDKLLGALHHGFYEIDEKTGNKNFLVDPEVHLPDNRFNDGKCDPNGRFWAGTMHIPETEVTGNLYVLENDGTVSHKISDIGCSNGLAWNSTGDTLYYIDSPTRQVVAYDYSLETAEITNRRVVITISEGGGFPDGMTIDAEDQLWVALWDGWKLIRVNPATGEVTDQIDLPVARITSAVFGGPDYGDLYITSAKVGLDDTQLKDQPLAGSLFVVENVGVKGRPAFRYRREN